MVSMLLCLAALNPAAPLDERKSAWQLSLDKGTFHYPEKDGLVWYLGQFGGDCRIHLVFDPKDRWKMQYRFEREGKDVVTIDGHSGSSFRGDKTVLYFAHFPVSTSGCVVTAHDLATGKKLWETKLSAVGTPPHSAYRNQVALDLSSLHGVDKDGEGVVRVTGRESFGDYVEVLDRATGAVLAHKVYRRGFGPPK